jgi:hypothetical protein
MKIALLLSTFVFLLVSCNVKRNNSNSDISLSYEVKNGAITGENTGRYNNRPLYINNTNAVVFAGDQPMARLVKDSLMYGTFMMAVVRGDNGKWLQQFDKIVSKYYGGIMSWTLTDPLFPDLKIIAEVLPLANNFGMAVHCYAEGATEGDRLIWAYGGAFGPKKKISIWPEDFTWDLDVSYYPDILKWGFKAGDCKNNIIEIDESSFRVSLTDSVLKRFFTVIAGSNLNDLPKVGNASEWTEVLRFNNSKVEDLPLLRAEGVLENKKNYYWACEAFNEGNQVSLTNVIDPERSFTEGKKKLDAIQDRIKIKTPDPYLNAAALASMIAVDGTWQSPTYMHGALYGRMPLPGWRSIYGGTMYGWHDRVKTEAGYYTSFQTKVSDKTEPKASIGAKLTEQDRDSRFFGVGHIDKDQRGYDMQSQFFDQLIEDWRWTADPELEIILRPALELHLVWAKECFDPDGDGTYESYKNSFPTDSQWYNGGGSAEETSYAYRGHLAARDMARRAGDLEREKYHTQMQEKIKKGFFNKLWIKDKGYSGAYREQGGHERLHQDPWLYSIFLPIEAEMLSPIQSIESVYYSEWALQNDPVPGGGRRVWPSNWVPALWSVRELWSGDEYALAQSYFKAGLANDGWDVMRGAMKANAFQSVVPGNVSSPQCGTDFGDNLHPFARVLVEGLFGYQPDYPNESVNFSPQFPNDWKDASVELPDVKIEFSKNDSVIKYKLGLSKKAKINMQLAVAAGNVEKVNVNGKSFKWKLNPGVGLSLVMLELPETSDADVEIHFGNPLPYHGPEAVETNVSDLITLKVSESKIMEIYDPQEVLQDQQIKEGTFSAHIKSGSKGFHTVIASVMVDKAPQWRVFRINVKDREADARNLERVVHSVPSNAKWESINISSRLNADVRTIYQQKYMSPRPNTSSLRLGIDGYSSWTQQHWAKKRPPLSFGLDSVKNMMDDKGHLITPQKVPFLWSGVEKNVSFTSMWDNYPTSIDFPVNKKGDAIYFLICGSTNVMQCQIANAVLRLKYADGSLDSLVLIPPVNYWNLCPIIGKKLDARADYTSEVDKFPIPEKWPDRVQLGENCRAILLNLKMKNGVELNDVTLETLSQEVVVGLMGISIMNPND